MTPSELLIWGLVIHLGVDLLLQNEWMALNKVSLKHPAAYVHSGLHFCGLVWIFPWWIALGVATTHLLIDTRVPLRWWREFYGQTRDPNNPMSIHVAFWGDQTLHIVVIAVASLLVR